MNLKYRMIPSGYRIPSGKAAPVPSQVAASGTRPQECGPVHDVCREAEHGQGAPLVSVVIPCYNQAHFLGEAIESVLKQTYRHVKILVVNDGSADNTSEVVCKYSEVRYVEQVNQGLSAARNTGIRESKGQYLVFLDADDRLCPIAVEAGLHCFSTHPQCAFIYGTYRFIASNESPLGKPKSNRVEKDHYLALLRGNYIKMNATVMYRRAVLESIGGFDISLDACEDYDLYLRITRDYPVYFHDQVVAEYRMHDGQMSRDARLMLKSALTALGSQWQYVKADKWYRRSYRAGIRFWKECYGQELIKQVVHMGVRGECKQAVQGVETLLRYVGGIPLLLYTPRWFFKYTAKKLTELAAAR